MNEQRRVLRTVKSAYLRLGHAEGPRRLPDAIAFIDVKSAYLWLGHAEVSLDQCEKGEAGKLSRAKAEVKEASDMLRKVLVAHGMEG